MALPRIIPVLLLDYDGLVKTIKFKKPNYLGDPINAVKIFNDKFADEIVILDITATEERRKPNFNLIQDIGSEAFMPFAYGGAVDNVEDAIRILKSGAEKIILNKIVFSKPKLVTNLASRIGSSSVVVSIDIKKNLFGKYRVFSDRGKINTKLDPIEHAKAMVELGAGEIFINNISNDGLMQGYDTKYLTKLIKALEVPVVVCGGAKSKDDIVDLFNKSDVSGCAAGSMFVYNGPHKAFLISYPDVQEIIKTIKK